MSNGSGTFVPPATTKDAGKSYVQRGWRIETHKFPICNAAEIDAMTSALGIAPPEMIFGNNSVAITHVRSGWAIVFNAFDALDVVDKTGEAGMLKVAYSEQWQKMREKVSEDIRDVVRPFDWTYSSAARGRELWKDDSGGGESQETEKEKEHKKEHDDQLSALRLASSLTAAIPFDKLKRPDPILLFDEVMLYEDELADNGIAMLNVKVRVMPERLLLLQRFFLRLDDVVIRIRDTRVYVEFATGEVVREYQAREDSYANVKMKFYMYPQDDVPGMLRDPQKLVDLLPIVAEAKESTVVR